MTSTAHLRLPDPAIGGDVVPLRGTTDVYLAAYLAPFASWFADDTVTEILVNEPGLVWIEAGGTMRREKVPAIDDQAIRRLAEQVARVSHQGINRERPLLAATLPDGTRVQFAGPPATRGHWAMAMRRHRLVETTLDAYARPRDGAAQAVPPEADAAEDPIGYLRACVAARRTILISGGTSSGKTTFLNALLREVSPEQRIVIVEDTPEIRLAGGNGIGLLAVKGETGEARVTTDDLLQAALRLRPDRIVLGELRGVEAVSFLRAINTGHPGSFSTIHANSPAGALDQLALMVMQAGLGLSRMDTLAYAKSVIDVVVQLDRQDGRRGIAAVTPTSNL
ncbi:P-type DNA transfer ATPase VirB11 [Sphingomonas carotinifaciens]|uniref:Type IV secretion system protein n=1 Tax=Sphingomonas carotinifaciens TaxID=1166323 RepID=A0A1G7PVS6_9SPHN|nr:P-type DNA transfer ATPase VirB11 [Sphingomonas carotinifaciens]MBB4087529.1 type IV secretion system protein VirB11 [Sphingomonas carotinifaciens]MWC45615.1 P-type DNA transfer ATPase VirB11 [Sphingomonas carotinifaciens]SDF90366.1 type IV secretion system protein VirB11 [Sphingomonas carotinifaciens]